MHVNVRFLLLAFCAVLLLASAACSHTPADTLTVQRFFQQEHLGLSAGELPTVETKSESRAQTREGIERNSVIYKGGFDDDYGDEPVLISDPLKPWNMVWFYFNDGLYRVLLRPLGKGYNYVVPTQVRTGMENFLYNIKFPIRFVNNLLQGKVVEAGVEMSRFLGNTLFGGLGFMDITEYKEAAAPTPPEDFGQTLQAWGFGEGIYLVWPILGTSTVRDSFGTAGDYFFDPVTYIDPLFLNYSNPLWMSGTAYGTRTFVSFAGTIENYDDLWEAAIDPYTSFRNAYVQNRRREYNR